MNRNIIPDKCICGNSAKITGYYIKGVANHKNYFVKCNNCKTRTRSRKTPYKAVEEWNEYRGDLFLQQRKINVGVDMEEEKLNNLIYLLRIHHIDSEPLENLIKRNKKLQEENKELRKPKYIIDCKTNKVTKLTNDFVSKDKIRELQDKYKNKIEKLESKKIWNEPVDTIYKNRYTNYYNAYEELLQEGDK